MIGELTSIDEVRPRNHLGDLANLHISLSPLPLLLTFSMQQESPALAVSFDTMGRGFSLPVALPFVFFCF
jgi:hypothetical protein